MASEDYEYDYSDEDDYPIEDDMSWDATGDNPNAAPVVFSPKGECRYLFYTNSRGIVQSHMCTDTLDIL
jgi:hypothetical protein